ncbi:unnamed protein product [Ilex paraguariensis]|uniref:PH domain-containing protein n=1 Tax=Ilex paraguariensis TaxID=185542 RepID=A0ABC8QYW2_9AQUA
MASPPPPPLTSTNTKSEPLKTNNNHQDHNHGHKHVTMAESLSRGPSMREATQLVCGGDQREVKINDIVGNGISGILNKWVNYGKGWRPRWFVLQDGVLSYYKIHGPDKIVVNQETEKGSRVIGEESLRRISRCKNRSSQVRRNPVGEVHLKVSSIRESRSDDKRFSIFTGTKRLHLRADTREDRMAWMDALQAVKDMFPRMSNSELMAPLENVFVSTEKLRQRLLEEGTSEAAILDCEQIMRNEFAALQNQLVLLKQKHWLLIDTLRQLEWTHGIPRSKGQPDVAKSHLSLNNEGGVVRQSPPFIVRLIVEHDMASTHPWSTRSLSTRQEQHHEIQGVADMASSYPSLIFVQRGKSTIGRIEVNLVTNNQSSLAESVVEVKAYRQDPVTTEDLKDAKGIHNPSIYGLSINGSSTNRGDKVLVVSWVPHSWQCIWSHGVSLWCGQCSASNGSVSCVGSSENGFTELGFNARALHVVITLVTIVVVAGQSYVIMAALAALQMGKKVDLENTVVDESQRQLKDVGATSRLRQDKYSEASASASESDDDNERADAAEEETDDEDNAFFDTRDFLSSSSFKSNGSDFRTSSFSSDDDGLYAFESEDGSDPSIRSAGTNFPYVKRRKKLPDPAEKEKGVSLWSMIKDNIGKDLTKVCLPVYFNEPVSSLQKCFEDLEYSYLLDRAYEWGKTGNSLMRILNVAAFAVSGYASTDGRSCKPFNPLLGETYEADYPDKGLRFFSEKVSHHPMIVACHCEGTGWKFWGDSNLKSKFWGRAIQIDPVGVLTLEFDDGEIFQWSKVTTSIYNLILGKLYCDHYGTMRIQGNGNYSCKLKFKEQSIIERNPHQVQGIVQDRNGKTVATVFGKWDESIHYMNGDCSGKGRGFEYLSEAHLLWKRSRPPKFPTRYNFTRFAITLNELTPGLKEKLPPTDSRLRPDQRCLENGEFEMANSEKLRLEQRQRQARKMQESGWKPCWFEKDKGSDTYRYVGGYWEAREKGNWDSCRDIFGHIPSDQLSD